MPQLVSYQEKEQTLEVEVLQQQLRCRSWGEGGLLKLHCLKEIIWAEEIAHLGPEFDSPERGGWRWGTTDRDIVVMYFCIARATETGRPLRVSGYLPRMAILG